MTELQQHLSKVLERQPGGLPYLEKLRMADLYLCETFIRAIETKQNPDQKRFMDLMVLIWTYYERVPKFVEFLALVQVSLTEDPMDQDAEIIGLYEMVGRYHALAYKHIEGTPDKYTLYYARKIRPIVRNVVHQCLKTTSTSDSTKPSPTPESLYTSQG